MLETMFGKNLLLSGALLIGAWAKDDLLYNYIPTVETPISLSVKCRGSDSGACNGVEPGTIVPFETCSIPTGSLDPAATIENTCLTELGANYPDEDMSDILMIEVTVPEDATVGLVDAPIDVAN